MSDIFTSTQVDCQSCCSTNKITGKQLFYELLYPQSQHAQMFPVAAIIL